MVATEAEVPEHLQTIRRDESSRWLTQHAPEQIRGVAPCRLALLISR
jgi:hypothetical protein